MLGVPFQKSWRVLVAGALHHRRLSGFMSMCQRLRTPVICVRSFAYLDSCDARTRLPFPCLAVAFCIVMWLVTVLHVFLCECECESARPFVSFIVDWYVRVFDMFVHFAAKWVWVCARARLSASLLISKSGFST